MTNSKDNRVKPNQHSKDRTVMTKPNKRTATIYFEGNNSVYTAYKVKLLSTGVDVWAIVSNGYGGKVVEHTFYPYHTISFIRYDN